jgi:hypothetical protein
MPTLEVVRRWAARPRFLDANVGILTGLSGVTVLDVDDCGQVDAVVEMFGASPLVAATPRGGVHLYYASRGEGCANLRPHGLNADLKGIGGFIVAPPSKRPGRTDPEGAYRLVQGDWTVRTSLPPLVEGALERLRGEPPKSSDFSQSERDGAGRWPEGRRNSALFRKCLERAEDAQDEASLIEIALSLNEKQASPPLPAAEVVRTARSAWQTHVSGRNFVASPGIVLPHALVDGIADPDALWLYLTLRRKHPRASDPGYTFAIVARAMASAGVAKPLGEPAIRKAIRRLLEARVLERVKEGGRQKGDVHLYRLTA